MDHRPLAGSITRLLLEQVDQPAQVDFAPERTRPRGCNGDIVAALIGDRATVKTFLRAEDHVWPMPENPSYEPILGDGCQIMGKVVATIAAPGPAMTH